MKRLLGRAATVAAFTAFPCLAQESTHETVQSNINWRSLRNQIEASQKGDLSAASRDLRKSYTVKEKMSNKEDKSKDKAETTKSNRNKDIKQTFQNLIAQSEQKKEKKSRNYMYRNYQNNGFAETKNKKEKRDSEHENDDTFRGSNENVGKLTGIDDGAAAGWGDFNGDVNNAKASEPESFGFKSDGIEEDSYSAIESQKDSGNGENIKDGKDIKKMFEYLIAQSEERKKKKQQEFTPTFDESFRDSHDSVDIFTGTDGGNIIDMKSNRIKGGGNDESNADSHSDKGSQWGSWADHTPFNHEKTQWGIWAHYEYPPKTDDDEIKRRRLFDILKRHNLRRRALVSKVSAEIEPTRSRGLRKRKMRKKDSGHAKSNSKTEKSESKADAIALAENLSRDVDDRDYDIEVAKPSQGLRQKRNKTKKEENAKKKKIDEFIPKFDESFLDSADEVDIFEGLLAEESAQIVESVDDEDIPSGSTEPVFGSPGTESTGDLNSFDTNIDTSIDSSSPSRSPSLIPTIAPSSQTTTASSGITAGTTSQNGTAMYNGGIDSLDWVPDQSVKSSDTPSKSTPVPKEPDSFVGSKATYEGGLDSLDMAIEALEASSDQDSEIVQVPKKLDGQAGSMSTYGGGIDSLDAVLDHPDVDIDAPTVLKSVLEGPDPSVGSIEKVEGGTESLDTVIHVLDRSSSNDDSGVDPTPKTIDGVTFDGGLDSLDIFAGLIEHSTKEEKSSESSGFPSTRPSIAPTSSENKQFSTTEDNAGTYSGGTDSLDFAVDSPATTSETDRLDDAFSGGIDSLDLFDDLIDSSMDGEDENKER